MDPCRFPRWTTLSAPKGERPYTDATTSGAAPTSPPEGPLHPNTPYTTWTYGARIGRAVGTHWHYWPTRIHRAESLRHRRDRRSDTRILCHLRNYRWTQSLSVMTTGRPGLLEHGHRRSISRGSRTFQGLRAGCISGRTKQEYTAASGRHDHAIFRERADASVRCSGCTRLGLRLRDASILITFGAEHSREGCPLFSTILLSDCALGEFESAMNRQLAKAREPDLAHIRVRYTCVLSIRRTG